MGLDAVILVFLMLSFKPTFSLSSHFHQEALKYTKFQNHDSLINTVND